MLTLLRNGFIQRSADWRSSGKLKKNIIRNAEVQSIFQERQTSYCAKPLLATGFMNLNNYNKTMLRAFLEVILWVLARRCWLMGF